MTPPPPDPPLDPFDPKLLELPLNDLAQFQPSSQRPPRHKRGELFLKGPIPWCWLEQAARLKRRALMVGLLLWREAGFRRQRTVPFNLTRRAQAVGFSLRTVRRCLRKLEQAKLVAVDHHPGCCLEVTLLDAPAASQPGLEE
jgi:hypothetical protein